MRPGFDGTVLWGEVDVGVVVEVIGDCGDVGEVGIFGEQEEVVADEAVVGVFLNDVVGAGEADRAGVCADAFVGRGG